MVYFVEFLKPEACSQTALPDRSLLIRQKLVANAKIQMLHFEEFSNSVSWSLNDNKPLWFLVLALELVINFQTWMTWKNQVIQL